LALLLVACGILYSGSVKIMRWFQGDILTAPGILAFWVALLSIAVKECIYRYTTAKARRLNSQALEANAWHHRSDALSSVGTALGIGGAILLGNRWTVLDPVASIVVGAMLVKVAVELLKASMGELTESSLPAEMENEIMGIIQSFPDVKQPHNLRTRRIGNHIAVEAHIRMDGHLSLHEVHERATAIENKLKERFGQDTHVTIHMEPVK
jgi:cation diffusion facilitator family transporter